MRSHRLFFLLLCPAILAAQEVRLEASSGGRVFEGFGTLSAGASSKLLIDYPEPQRSEVLDLLFKPKYGAASSTSRWRSAATSTRRAARSLRSPIRARNSSRPTRPTSSAGTNGG